MLAAWLYCQRNRSIIKQQWAAALKQPIHHVVQGQLSLSLIQWQCGPKSAFRYYSYDVIIKKKCFSKCF